MNDLLTPYFTDHNPSQFNLTFTHNLLHQFVWHHNQFGINDKEYKFWLNRIWECVESSVWCHVFDQSLASDQIERTCHKNADGIINALRKERDQIQNQLVEIILEKE